MYTGKCGSRIFIRWEALRLKPFANGRWWNFGHLVTLWGISKNEFSLFRPYNHRMKGVVQKRNSGSNFQGKAYLSTGIILEKSASPPWRNSPLLCQRKNTLNLFFFFIFRFIYWKIINWLNKIDLAHVCLYLRQMLVIFKENAFCRAWEFWRDFWK